MTKQTLPLVIAIMAKMAIMAIFGDTHQQGPTGYPLKEHLKMAQLCQPQPFFPKKYLEQMCKLKMDQQKRLIYETIYHSKRLNTEIKLFQYFLQERGIFHDTLPREYTEQLERRLVRESSSC